MKKSWKELHDASTPAEFREILIQDLVFEKFKAKQYKRNFRATVVCLFGALIASIIISVWSIVSIKSEYALQMKVMQNAIERERAAYKKDKALPDILFIGSRATRGHLRQHPFPGNIF